MNVKEKLWNILFSILFLILLIVLFPKFPINELMEIKILELILIVIATQRLIRLIVYDRIMVFFRDFFPKNKDSFCDCVHSLISCPWCFGVWAALIILSLYFLTNYGKIIVLLLAISSLASILQISINFIGWSAELKKQKSQNFKK